jgi:hypothetical protein
MKWDGVFVTVLFREGGPGYLLFSVYVYGMQLQQQCLLQSCRTASMILV